MLAAWLACQWLVRFPNCHECQLGFQCPKKWELWKQWPILEENSIAGASYWDKLTSYMSHKAISATKKSPTVTVAHLEDPTCHPPNPHFGWRPFSTVGFVPKVILYLRKQFFKFPPNPHFGWRLFSTVGFVHKVIFFSSEGALVAIAPYDYPWQPLFEHTPVLDNNFEH